MNRGSDDLDVAGVLFLMASMRPRFMNRGSADIRRFLQEILQSFNEAPIHESGK